MGLSGSVEWSGPRLPPDVIPGPLHLAIASPRFKLCESCGALVETR